MKKEDLTQEELEERIAILKRFRTLLEQQREKFQEYLIVLEKQHERIEADDTDSLEAHTALENQIVSNIRSLQKVIVPMQALYETKSGAGDSSIAQIQNDLDNLQQKVLLQNERNRQLLQSHMTELKSQINAFASSNPYRGLRSVYAERPTGSMISIEG